MQIRQWIMLASILFGAFTAEAVSQVDSPNSWTRFRGPNGSGVVPDASLPGTWTADDYDWRVELAGSGSSSPVVWGDRVFVTSCNPDTAALIVQCLDLQSGQEVWSKSFDSQPYRMHDRNSLASSTPAVDSEHVYIAYANPQSTVLAALDHNGNEVWQRDFGRWVSAHGFGVSPVIYGEMVLFINSQQGVRMPPGVDAGQSRMIAVNCHDGQDIWSTHLSTTRACYALPCLYKAPDGSEQIVCYNTGNGFYGLNPKSGELLWQLPAFDLRTVASTVTHRDMFFGSCGSGGGGNRLVAIKLDGEQPSKVFEVTQSANYVPTPLVVDGRLFTISDRGIASCLDAETGELHWRERILSDCSSSLVANDQYVYFTDDRGDVAVVRTTPEFELVSKVSLGEGTRATPAIVGDRILFRTDRHLMSLGGKADADR